MRFDNICVQAIAIMFLVFAVGFFLSNFSSFFSKRSIRWFVLCNELYLFICGFCAYKLYYMETSWIWKILLCIAVIDLWWFGAMIIRYLVFAYIPDGYEIINGDLLRVNANSSIIKIKIPARCTSIAPAAISNLPDLEEIVFPESISEFSENMVLNCPRLQKKTFKNKNVTILEKI